MTQMTRNSDTFNFPTLGLTIERGNMGCPSKVTLDWIVCGDEEDTTYDLTLTCDILINHEDACRELVISAIGGADEAVSDFMCYVRGAQLHELTELPPYYDSLDYEEDRLHDVATGLGMALLLDDYTVKYPDLFVVVSAQVK